MTRRQIIAADWADNYMPLSAIVLTTIVFMIVAAWLEPGGFGPKLVVLISTVLCAPFITLRCFTIPRDEDRLKTLLGPATKAQIIVTKFLSALLMALFVVNMPGGILLEPRFLFNLNGLVLFLTTVCMSAEVVSIRLGGLAGEGFGGVSILIGCVLLSSTDSINSWFPTVMEYGKVCFYWLIANSTFFSVAGLCLIPIIVAWSTVRRETMADEIRKGVLNL